MDRFRVVLTIEAESIEDVIGRVLRDGDLTVSDLRVFKEWQ